MKTLLLLVLLSINIQNAWAAKAVNSSLSVSTFPVNTLSNPWLELNPKLLKLRSAAALVVDSSGASVFEKQTDSPMPIASVTKLMTAMVILDSGLPLDQLITITKQDRDLVRLTGSRLKYGASLPRKEMLQLAVMASENRAASALARTFPGGTAAFVVAMNKKAKQLGMSQSHFSDPAGLRVENVASARDLVKMVTAASGYPLIEAASGTRKLTVHPYSKRGPLTFGNTNRLLKNKAWDISVSKTGYINEAGRCLVMIAEVDGNELTFVLLNSFGKLTPYGDSNRIRKWIRQGI